MRSLSKNVVWAITTLLLIAFIFSVFYTAQKTPTILSIDELAQKITRGEVSRIIVSGNDLEIELKGGEKAVSKKETEAGFTETLKNYGVDPVVLQKVHLEINDQSGFRFWAEVL